MKNLTLVKGVTGGFVEATPELHILIDVGEKMVSIQKSVKSSDLSAVDGFVTKSAEIDAGQSASIILEWEAILKTLPVEEPKGCEDIYGLDYCLQFQSNGFKWANTPNQGCNSTPSKVVPSVEQKQNFQRLVSQIESFADSNVK